MIEIKQLTLGNEAILTDINNLMRTMSLGPTPPEPLSLEKLNEMLAQPSLHFLAAMAGSGKIVGIASLYFIQIPSGLISILEDLVVDGAYHKLGVGRLLVERAIDIAKEERTRHISLRTNPKRLEANKLYRALGFQQLETNFYRINLFN